MAVIYSNNSYYNNGSFNNGQTELLLSNTGSVDTVVTGVEVRGTLSFPGQDLTVLDWLENNYLAGCGIFPTASFPGLNDGANFSGWLWWGGLSNAAGGNWNGLLYAPSTDTGGYVAAYDVGWRYRGQVPLPVDSSVWWAWSINTAAPAPMQAAFQGGITVFYDSYPVTNT